MPADDHEMALPCASVMVIMVLLKLALICATPLVMFFLSRRRIRPGSRSIVVCPLTRQKEKACKGGEPARLLLLARDGLGLALAGAGVGVSALAANGQARTVTQAAIGTQVHQTLDVHRGLATKIAFDGEIRIDRFANAQDFLIGQVLDACGMRD